MIQRVVTALSATLLFSVLVGCGGINPQSRFQGTAPSASSGGTSSQSSTFSVTLLPASTTVFAGGNAYFSSPYIGNVVWKVNGTPGGESVHGTIDASGNYTAPSMPPADAVTVTAELGDSAASLSASATVAVLSAGSVAPTANPLVAAYTITMPDKSSVNVEFGNDRSYDLQTSQFSAPAGGGVVRILVAGMRAGSTYHMRASLQLPGGILVQDVDHVFQTGNVPATLVPQLAVTRFQEALESSGVQLLDGVNTSSGYSTMYATDRDGNVVWYYADPEKQNPPPVKLTQDGNFILANIDEILEVNLAGETVRTIPILAIQTALTNAGYTLPITALHHDLEMLPNHHLIVLAETSRDVTLAGSNSPQTITGDVLIDLDENLNVVWAWNEFDHLDVNRHPFSVNDWTHTNAVVYLPRDGNLLVSMRHQSWIIKVDYQNGTGTGDILWKLGYQGDFALTGGTDPIDWFSMQHNPYVIADQPGKMAIGIFDNGNQRIMDSQGDFCGTGTQAPCYSRGIVMTLDENAMTAHLDWQANPDLFTLWGGSIQQVPNGNVIVDFNAQPFGSRIVEYTSDSPPVVVWQMDVTGQSEYRSIRLPSLYPGVVWP